MKPVDGMLFSWLAFGAVAPLAKVDVVTAPAAMLGDG